MRKVWGIYRGKVAVEGLEQVTVWKKSLLLQEQISWADPRTVSGNSHQQGKTPSNAPGTSSIRKTPLRQTDIPYDLLRACVTHLHRQLLRLVTAVSASNTEPLKATVCFKQTTSCDHTWGLPVPNGQTQWQGQKPAIIQRVELWGSMQTLGTVSPRRHSCVVNMKSDEKVGWRMKKESLRVQRVEVQILHTFIPPHTGPIAAQSGCCLLVCVWKVT